MSVKHEGKINTHTACHNSSSFFSRLHFCVCKDYNFIFLARRGRERARRGFERRRDGGVERAGEETKVEIVSLYLGSM